MAADVGSGGGGCRELVLLLAWERAAAAPGAPAGKADMIAVDEGCGCPKEAPERH